MSGGRSILARVILTCISFAGTEQGIFQYAVNMADRMTFPSIEFR